MDAPVTPTERKPVKKKRTIVKLCILGILLIAGFIFAFCPMQAGMTVYTPFANSIKLGLDLQGGMYAVYQAENTDTENFSSKLEGTRQALETLIVNKGYTEATVVIEGEDRLRVEVPSVENTEEILNIVGEPAQVSFVLDDTSEVVLTGENVVNAQGAYTASDGYFVALELDSEGAEAFSKATGENIGKTMSIQVTIAGETTTISSPNIESQISNGRAIINGFSSVSEAQNLADQIMSGTFDVELSIRETETISPTLGDNALKYGLIAGIIGLVLIIVFLCLFYRMFGVAASCALGFFVIIYLFFLAVLPWVQLTLPGIAGVLLSIGMAVDANIVIFERIKDEYRNGKSIVSAVHSGFKKATIAIIDSNVTTIIAAILLYILGTGSVKGFALTLLVGILISLFTSLFISRKLVQYEIVLNNSRADLYRLKRGVGFETLTADMTDPRVAERMEQDRIEREKAKQKRLDKRNKKKKLVKEEDSYTDADSEKFKADAISLESEHDNEQAATEDVRDDTVALGLDGLPIGESADESLDDNENDVSSDADNSDSNKEGE